LVNEIDENSTVDDNDHDHDDDDDDDDDDETMIIGFSCVN